MSKVDWALLISLCVLSKHIWQAGLGIYRRIFTSGQKQQMTVAQAQEFVKRIEEFRRELRQVNRDNLLDRQDIYEAMSKQNELTNERHQEFYQEFVRLQVKVAAWTGDSNGHT